MLDGLVCDGELSEVVSDHLRLHLDGDEHLAVVHADGRADHLRHDDHVAQVRAHGRGLLPGSCLALRLAQSLDERERLALESSLEAAARSRVEELDEFVGGHVQERIEVHALEGELAERPLLLLLLTRCVVAHGCCFVENAGGSNKGGGQRRRRSARDPSSEKNTQKPWGIPVQNDSRGLVK